MNSPKLSYIIVAYNNADTIAACLESIRANTSNPYEIVVMDNSPGRDTALAVLAFIGARPDVALRLVESGENIGFSRASNAGARLASGDFLFFLNPDTQLLNDSGKFLLDCFERNPRARAVGPAIFDAAGHVTRTCRNLPNLARIVLDVTGIDRWCGAYKLTHFGHDVAKQVEQIIGAAILLKARDYQELGGMDERFFVYFEEVDLCKRLKDAGGEIWFWPAARVQHLAGRSCEVNSVRARMIFTLRESRRKYFRKHFGARAATVLELVNRVEGLQKSVTLAALWLIRGKRSYREKAQGFWCVATGVAPRSEAH